MRIPHGTGCFPLLSMRNAILFLNANASGARIIMVSSYGIHTFSCHCSFPPQLKVPPHRNPSTCKRCSLRHNHFHVRTNVAASGPIQSPSSLRQSSGIVATCVQVCLKPMSWLSTNSSDAHGPTRQQSALHKNAPWPQLAPQLPQLLMLQAR